MKKRKQNVVNYFFLGIILTVVIQSLFMFGGLIVEKKMGVSITGIPSAIGLTVVLLAGLLMYKKSMFILLGSFAIAFLSPLILLLIVLFGAMDFLSPIVYYSLIYMVIIVIAVYSYYTKRIIKDDF